MAARSGILDLGSRLYPGNMQRIFNKDLTRFMQSLSRERQNRASKIKALLAGCSELCSIPVMSSTSQTKVVVYFGENRFVPFSSICSVMKVSRYKYFDSYLVANNFIKTIEGQQLAIT